MQFPSNSPLNANHSTEFESNTALLAPAGAVSATFWQRSLSETVIDSIQRGSAAQAKAGISVKPEPNWCSWWFPWRCCWCYSLGEAATCRAAPLLLGARRGLAGQGGDLQMQAPTLAAQPQQGAP